MKKITLIILSLILLTACNSGADRFTFEVFTKDSAGKEQIGPDAPYDKDYELTIYTVEDHGGGSKYFLSRAGQSYVIENIHIKSQYQSRQPFKHTFTLDESDWTAIDWDLAMLLNDKDIFWTEEFLNTATGMAYKINDKAYYSYPHPHFFKKIQKLVKSSPDFQYDFTFCEQLGESREHWNTKIGIGYLLKDGCYVDMAITLNNPQICQKVTPGEASENCRGNVFYENASKYKNFATEEFCSQFQESVAATSGGGKTNPVRAKCLELVKSASSELK